MASEQHEREAADRIKEARQLMPRVILFALVVLMSQLLDIQPSTVDAGGVKIAVRDAVVIRGGIALVFYYYVFSALTAWMDGSYSVRHKPRSYNARTLIRNWSAARISGKKHKLTPAQVKRHVRSMLRFRLFIDFPFFLVRFYIIVLALAVAMPDAWRFGEYVSAQIHGRKATH